MDEGLADEDPLGKVLRPSTTLIRTMVEDNTARRAAFLEQVAQESSESTEGARGGGTG
jgi:hypothetical protein